MSEKSAANLLERIAADAESREIPVCLKPDDIRRIVALLRAGEQMAEHLRSDHPTAAALAAWEHAIK